MTNRIIVAKCWTHLPTVPDELILRWESQYSSRPLRWRLIVERRFLASIRRSTEPFVGLVSRRARAGGAIAAPSSSTSRRSAASRFRSCERCSDAVMLSTPSVNRPASRSNALARCVSLSEGELAMSKSNSARESVVFTPWPPGPDDRENRQDNSDSGITIDRTLSGPGTRPACLSTGQRRGKRQADPRTHRPTGGRFRRSSEVSSGKSSPRPRTSTPTTESAPHLSFVT